MKAFMYVSRNSLAAMLLVFVAGCASLLPDGRQETRTPWETYAQAQAMFARIIPNETTVAELKALGVDPDKTPNVAVLSHADLLRRLVSTSSLDVKLLDHGLQQCVSSHKTCYAYEIEQKHIERKRFGNFWLDFFNFHRKTNITGWEFDAIVVVRDGKVIYKLWSGKPGIHQFEEERMPLGPFQSIGTSYMMTR
ncbi:MAG: hypothetical protein H6R01_639 [Burkholderiaceae bacterium]|nr:hypothetical protein [Burkholderiaceae bacterium]